MNTWPTLDDLVDIAAILLAGLALVALVLGPAWVADRADGLAPLWRRLRRRKAKAPTFRPATGIAYMSVTTYDRLADAANLAGELGLGSDYLGLRIVATQHVPDGKVIVVDHAAADAIFDAALTQAVHTPDPDFDRLYIETVRRRIIDPARPFDWTIDA